jgi:hypothetical protein
MLVRLWLGVLDNNWLCGGASTDRSNNLSNMVGPRVPQSIRDGRVVHARPQVERLAEGRPRVYRWGLLEWRGKCRNYRDSFILGRKDEPTREMEARHAFFMTLVFVPVVGFSEIHI